MIAYFIGNISAKKYQNPFMCVKVIASQRWDVFLRHGVDISHTTVPAQITDVPSKVSAFISTLHSSAIGSVATKTNDNFGRGPKDVVPLPPNSF